MLKGNVPDELAGSTELTLDLSQISTKLVPLALELRNYSTAQKPEKTPLSGITENSLGSNITKIIGSNNDDYIFGTYAAETISGGAGNDRLLGGGGDDTLTGGDGDDIFKLELATDTDTVTDFGTGDKVRIFKTLRNESSLAEFGVSVDVNDEGDTIFTYDSVDIMVLENFTGFDENTHLDIQ